MGPVKKHLGYLISYTKFVHLMSTKMADLDEKRGHVDNHVQSNEASDLQIPTDVSTWLNKVGIIKAEVESFCSDVNNCFNLKMRYKIGKKAFNTLQRIDGLINESPGTRWTGDTKILGKVDSNKAFASTGYIDFGSRESVLEKALKALESDHKSQMVALCGMGGVGKTKMMEKLLEVVTKKKMFDLIVKATVGNTTDPIVLQRAMADYLSIPLAEGTKEARADRLLEAFKARSKEGKCKILVILDDVWQLVDLNDIGLSPLPNQGVGFKFLLTSRDENVCIRMGVESASILKVDVLKDSDAQSFFRQFAGISNDTNRELQKIGEDIVGTCGGLPIAIKTIALNLKGQTMDEWNDALSRLERHDSDDITCEIFKMSYENLEEEAIDIFRLCGLFPEDFDIVVEDLMHYGWGLKLFKKVVGIREARYRSNACVRRLIRSNLLIEGDRPGCVKMHDLVRDYVLSISEHESIVCHGGMSELATKDMSKSYERISLTCAGMSMFPGEFNCQNLLLFKLMNGDESLKFPEDFYRRMEKLQLIDYGRLRYPLLPGSLQCSTNLRTLRLHSCSLLYDLSHIENLMNLEILSFAGCGIRKLPSTIGNLRLLKLLDLTGCICLQIDDGVLANLRLEELYMRVDYQAGIRFTDTNCDELKKLSENLYALEVEFFENKADPSNVSFNKLERFRISMGRYLEEGEGNFENTLILDTNKDELLKSKINGLFPKTEVLRLRVKDLDDVEDILEPLCTRQPLPFQNLRVLEVFDCAKLTFLFSIPVAQGLCKLERLTVSSCPVLEEIVHLRDCQPSPFQNLRELDVSDCAKLTFLFSFPVAQGLSKLERLTVSLCPVLEEIVHLDDNEAEMIGFEKLCYLALAKLPKLESLCRDVDVIELPELVELRLDGLPNLTSIYPENKSTTSSMFGNISTMQPFFNEKVVIPKLEILDIGEMEKLTEIWPSGNKGVNICILKKINVVECHRLVNLFPMNPMPLLHHLESLFISGCSSIKAIFNIDLGCVHEIEERSSSSSSSLRRIELWELSNLREVWRMKDVNKSDHIIHDFRAVETIEIRECKRFRNVFTPTTANFDLGALKSLTIYFEPCINNELAVESSTNTQDQQQIGVVPNEDIMEMDDDIRDVVFPSHLMPTFLDSIEYLRLCGMERMSHVWNYNWNEFLISQHHQQSSFRNLTQIQIWHCGSIKYLFSPLMAKLLSNLKNVWIVRCDSIEEVISNRDDIDEEMSTSTSTHANIAFFPHLDEIYFDDLPCLERIGTSVHGRNTSTYNDTNTYASIHDQFQCAKVTLPCSSLCQYSKIIRIYNCKALSCVIPSHLVGQPQKVEELIICDCESMVELFETKRVNNEGIHVDGGSEGANNILTIPRQTNTTLLELPNLKILKIVECNLLGHIFMSSTLESLNQLKELEIKRCKAMQVIVKEEDGADTTTSKLVVFPRLQSLKLVDLPDLKGFFFGKNEFNWPLLDKVTINGCPQMRVLTFGHSKAPNLYYMHTSLGKHSLECGLNFHLTTASQEETRELLQFPWSFSNLIEVDLAYPFNDTIVFPCNELPNLQNLEKIHFMGTDVKEVFEVVEGKNDDANKTQHVVIFPKLKDLTIYEASELRYMWKANKWTILKFPCLTTLSIVQCQSLEHVFTCSMVGSLLQLQELHINYCPNMEVIVKEEEEETKMKEVVFPCLKSLTLEELPKLKGFCLGNEDFTWESLDTLKIEECHNLTVFTNGKSATPKLKEIDTIVGRCYAREDLNSFIKTKKQEGFEF